MKYYEVAQSHPDALKIQCRPHNKAAVMPKSH